MGDAETVAPGVESSTSIIEQLRNTFTELKSHEEASEDMVQWKELEEYFLNLETLAKKKSAELEEKAKAVQEKESETRKLIQERETVVIAKEQDLVEQIQALKDAAVAAIKEAWAKNNPASPEPAIAVDSANGEPDINIPDQDPIPVEPRPELMQFCEQMDVKGLLNFLLENEKDISAIQKELPFALKRATEPARLVLRTVEGFYPPDENTSQGDDTNAALQGLRKSCVMLLESVCPLFVGDETDIDQILNPDTKQLAKVIADEWKSRMVEVGTDVATGNLLEAEAFLQLLSTFRIASEFGEDELYKLFLAIAHDRQTPELCRSLGLTDKVPGFVETLINTGRQIEAVHFVHAFELTSSFPLVPLLQDYLRETRRDSQGKPGTQIDVNTQELNAVRAVIKCVKEYKLEPKYKLIPLQRRATQLEKAAKNAKNDKKRPGETVRHPQQKKPRVNEGGYYGRQTQMPAAPANRRFSTAYGSGIAERYPQVGASTYDYQGPSPSVYGQHDIPQRSYYYPQDERVPPPSHGGVPSYGAPPPYGVPPSNYGAVSPYGNAPNYGAYGSSGAPPASHPSYPSY